MTQKEIYNKALKEYEDKVKVFNDLHKWLKNYKKNEVLPSGRLVDKLAAELYKP